MPVLRSILTNALAGVLSLSCIAVGAHAQTQQPVAFIGDADIVQWASTPQFQAHTNWKSYGVIGQNNFDEILPQLQSVIASGKRPIVHLLMGSSQPLSSPGDPQSSIFLGFAATLEQVIKAAQAAKLTVIVGTIPFNSLPGNDVSDFNKWIFTYCTAHNIPVVNYDHALNGGTGFSASGSGTPGDQPGTLAGPQPVYYAGTAPYLTPTSQAWDVMTDMAQTAVILAEGYKLKGGFLNTVVFDGDSTTDFDDYPTANTNSVFDGGYVQFTPYGQYSDGSTHIMNNANVNGLLGTWTNTNPNALSLDLYGAGRGMDNGSTTVRFTTPSGVTFSEWVMTTVVNDFGCGTNCPTY